MGQDTFYVEPFTGNAGDYENWLLKLSDVYLLEDILHTISTPIRTLDKTQLNSTTLITTTTCAQTEESSDSKSQTQSSIKTGILLLQIFLSVKV